MARKWIPPTHYLHKIWKVIETFCFLVKACVHFTYDILYVNNSNQENVVLSYFDILILGNLINSLAPGKCDSNF